MEVKDQLSKHMKIRENDDDNEEIEKAGNIKMYRILVVGDYSVGKTSICTRFSQNEFSLEIKPSTETEAFPKAMKVFEQFIQVYLIDVNTKSLENIEELIKSENNDIQGVVVVYDITKTKTFEQVDKWIEEIKKFLADKAQFILIGNKTDLKFLRNIDAEEAKEKASKHDCELIETSCVDEDSVVNALKFLVAKIYYSELPENKKNEIKIQAEKDNKGEDNINNENNDENKKE